MALRDFEAFIRQRALIFDPTMDVSAGSPFDTTVIQPLSRRLGTDPFTVDLATFLTTRLQQAMPEIAAREGDALTDLLVKPAVLLWDPLVREIQRVKSQLSFKDPSKLTLEEADALAANIFASMHSGEYARGVARLRFLQPQGITVSPINFLSSKTGLRFFPTELQEIRTEEMLLNVDDDGLYYFDINVIAESPGVKYNIEPRALISIANLPSVTSVTNLKRFSQGANEDTAQELIDRAGGEITERSLVTLRGISAKVIRSYPEVTRLNVVGFNDPEMQRDIVTGGGLGEIVVAGIAGYTDDDGEGKPTSRRFTVPTSEADFTTLISGAQSLVDGWVITIFGGFSGSTVAADLTIRNIVGTSGGLSTVEFEEQTLVLGKTNLRWALRRKSLTLSNIPGGILFPDGAAGTMEVTSDSVHIGGTTDVHVAGGGNDESTLMIEAVADDEPEASGTKLTVSAGLITLADYTLDSNYTAADDLYDVFKMAGIEGMTLEIPDGPNANVYRIVNVNQLSGFAVTVETSPEPPTNDATQRRWKISSGVNIDLIDPKETRVSGTDLLTVQNSNTVTTAGNTDFNTLGVAQDDVLRILTGGDASDYVVTVTPPSTVLTLDKPLSFTNSSVQYTIFRANAAGGVNRPFVRMTKVELLDSSKQPLGSIIPYAKPVDIQSRSFQNPSRGVKHDIRDARLGIVSQVTGKKATGTINVNNTSIADGVTFTLSDGVNTATTFEFDKNGSVTPGNVAVNIATAITVTEIREAMVAAINSTAGSLYITAVSDVTPGGIILTNDYPGTAGNTTISHTAGGSLTDTDMTGGVNDAYAVTAGDTLILNFANLEGAAPTVVTVTFTNTNPTLAQVITDISAAIQASPTIAVPNGAINMGDRFGIRPFKQGCYIYSGTALAALFGAAEYVTSWDVRSDSVEAAGGWASLEPGVDYESGIDVLQVMDGNQIGFYHIPYQLNYNNALAPAASASRALLLVDENLYIEKSTTTFAPEVGVRVQLGSRSIGSARMYFLDPTSIELNKNTRFDITTDVGTLRFLPDPTLDITRVPPPASNKVAKDGEGAGLSFTFESAAFDFVRLGIRRGDVLNITYVPINCSKVLTNPVNSLAGQSFTYSLDGAADRTLIFVKDDASLSVGQVSRDGVVNQINAFVGENICSLNASNKLVFSTAKRLVIRRSGTANDTIFDTRDDLPAIAKYDFVLADQANDSPHQGSYVVASVATSLTTSTLTLQTALPSSGDFSNLVEDQYFTVTRGWAQRISTTEMAKSKAEAGLYYWDVELVSEGTGDQWNIDDRTQLTASSYNSDGYYLTTGDENLSFSPSESLKIAISKSILEEGVDDDPASATEITGQNIQLTYERSQIVEDINNFVTSELERVVCSNPLARYLVPHFVRFDLTYIGGSAEDVVLQDIENYINKLYPNDALEVSDLERIVNNRGASSIVNPVDLIAVVHNPDRTITVARSQNSLTTGRLAVFTPDAVTVKRNTI